MTEIAIYTRLSDLDILSETWDHLRKREPKFFPSFQELRYSLQSSGCQFRLLVARDHSDVVGVACFVIEDRKKKFRMGARVLFALPIRVIDLYGDSVLGQVDPKTIAKFFDLIIKEWEFDLINLGEIVIGSALHQAITYLFP